MGFFPEDQKLTLSTEIHQCKDELYDAEHQRVHRCFVSIEGKGGSGSIMYVEEDGQREAEQTGHRLSKGLDTKNAVLD